MEPLHVSICSREACNPPGFIPASAFSPPARPAEVSPCREVTARAPSSMAALMSNKTSKLLLQLFVAEEEYLIESVSSSQLLVFLGK